MQGSDNSQIWGILWNFVAKIENRDNFYMGTWKAWLEFVTRLTFRREDCSITEYEFLELYSCRFLVVLRSFLGFTSYCNKSKMRSNFLLFNQCISGTQLTNYRYPQTRSILLRNCFCARTSTHLITSFFKVCMFDTYGFK